MMSVAVVEPILIRATRSTSAPTPGGRGRFIGGGRLKGEIQTYGENEKLTGQ